MIKSNFVNSLELIGGTPLVKLNNVTPENGANIYAKLESFNPGGSVKDRIALAMVEDAEKKGLLKPGSTIIHIGLTQPSGIFDFRKTTLQEVMFIGTYCYTNKDFEKTLKILNNKEIGDLNWIEFRELRKGAEAFKQIHDGTCSSPKIILIP